MCLSPHISEHTVVGICLWNLWWKVCDCWRWYTHSIVPLPRLSHSWKEERVKHMGLSGEQCTTPQKLCSWDPLRKPWRKKNPNWEWGHELLSLPVLLLHIIACKCAAVPAKRNSLFSETLLSLRWPESSNTHSPRGVQIRVCGCLFEVEGSR